MRSRSSKVLLAIPIACALAWSALAAAAGTSPRDVDALSKASLIYIATVRQDGNQSSPAPVWFTTTAGGTQILIQTSPTSWKARRIRRGSPAIVWIGSATGPALIGKAEITTDKALQDQIVDDYPKKYLLARFGYARPTREKFDDGKIISIRIVPVRDLPDGFASSPGTPAPKPDEKPAPAPQ